MFDVDEGTDRPFVAAQRRARRFSVTNENGFLVQGRDVVGDLLLERRVGENLTLSSRIDSEHRRDFFGELRPGNDTTADGALEKDDAGLLAEHHVDELAAGLAERRQLLCLALEK